MYFATAIPHYRRIIDVRFYVSVVEDVSVVDVDDMLRERERECAFMRAPARVPQAWD